MESNSSQSRTAEASNGSGFTVSDGSVGLLMAANSLASLPSDVIGDKKGISSGNSSVGGGIGSVSDGVSGDASPVSGDCVDEGVSVN